MSTPWITLLLAASGLAILAIFTFKCVSVPARIRKSRRLLMARLVETSLYQDSLASLFPTSIRLTKAFGAYLFALSAPLISSIAAVVPCLLFLAPLLSNEPIAPSKTVLVEVKLVENRGEPASTEIPHLEVESGLDLEASVVIPSERRVIWRMRQLDENQNRIRLVEANSQTNLEVRGGNRMAWTTKTWSNSSLVSLLPGVAYLPAASRIRSITLDYEERIFPIFGLDLNWLDALSLLSLAIAIPIAFLFRIAI